MTNRERFQKVMNFQKVDRLPMIEWAPWWDKTMEAWKDQGLKIEDSDKGMSQGEALQKQMGLDLNMVYALASPERTPRSPPITARPCAKRSRNMSGSCPRCTPRMR